MAELENTQVGDNLLSSAGWGQLILTVTHTTKTQVHCGTRKFRRDGRELGTDRWSRSYARTATEEQLAEVREEGKRRHLIGRIVTLCTRPNLAKLTTDQLVTIHELLVPNEK